MKGLPQHAGPVCFHNLHWIRKEYRIALGGCSLRQVLLKLTSAACRCCSNGLTWQADHWKKSVNCKGLYDFIFAGRDVPSMTMPCMVDSGNKVIVVAGFDGFQKNLHEGAPCGLCLKSVGQNWPLPGGAVGVDMNHMELAVLNVAGLQFFQCADFSIHLDDVGARVIIESPYLIPYNLMPLPQCEYLVPGDVLNTYFRFSSRLEGDISYVLCRPSHRCVHDLFARRLQNFSLRIRGTGSGESEVE